MEHLVKATHAADFLVSDLREFHKATAAQSRNVLEIAARDLLKQAVELKRRIVELSDAVDLDVEGSYGPA